MWNGNYSQSGEPRVAVGAIENCKTGNQPDTRQTNAEPCNSPDIEYLNAKTQELNSRIEMICEDMKRLQGRMAWFMSLPQAAKYLNLPARYLKELAANGSISVLPLKGGHLRFEMNTLTRELQKLFRKSSYFDGIVNPKPPKRVIWANANPLAI